VDHWHDDTTREAFVAEAKGEANFVQTALPESGRYSLLSEVPNPYERLASTHNFARNSA
jgi:hypothetical protein